MARQEKETASENRPYGRACSKKEKHEGEADCKLRYSMDSTELLKRCIRMAKGKKMYLNAQKEKKLYLNAQKKKDVFG